MDVVHARCCGLDVHKKSVVACVLITQPDSSVERHVRTFKTVTADLLKLADWARLVFRGAPGVDRDLLAARLQCAGR